MEKPKPRKSRKKQSANAKVLKSTEHVNQEDKPFDLGGLPERDLKKNLGCG
jgi:hypothetical protein